MILRHSHIFRVLISVTAILSLSLTSIQAARHKVHDISAEDVEASEQRLKKNPRDPELLQGLAMFYFRSDDHSKGEKYAVRLLEESGKTGDREFSEMWARFILGAIQSVRGDTSASMLNLETARTIAEANDDQNALSLIYNAFGIFYMFNHNDPYTASNYYYEALEAARKTRNLKREAPLIANLAGAYLTMEDPSGLKLAEQGVEMAERHDPGFTIKPRIILAQTYILNDSLDKARRLLNTITTRESEENKKAFAHSIQFLNAYITEKEGRIKDAIDMYSDLLKDEGDGPSGVSFISLSYARVLEKSGQYAKAIQILEKALSNSMDSQIQIHSSKIMVSLIRLYRKTGDKDKALDLSLAYKTYRDSLFTLSHHRSLQENRIRHEVFTNERQIDEQQMQLASKNHKIAFLAVVIALMAILLIVILTTARKRERLYRTIVARNSEFLERDRLQTEEIAHLKKILDETPQPKGDKQKATLPERDMNAELMQRFSEYMEKEHAYADQQLTIVTAAKALGTNRTYLSKAINATTGKTFLQTVNEYRMRRAVELISDVDADIPLKQISAELGYNSISTFYVTFQSYTGMTPAKYRSRVRELRETGMQTETDDAAPV